MDPELQAFIEQRRRQYQQQGYSPQELRAALDEDSANFWRQKQAGGNPGYMDRQRQGYEAQGYSPQEMRGALDEDNAAAWRQAQSGRQAYVDQQRKGYETQGYSPQEMRGALDEDNAAYYRNGNGPQVPEAPQSMPSAGPPVGQRTRAPAGSGRQRQTGNMMDPFSKFMDGLEYEARERGLKGEARKAHIANGIQTFRDRLYDDLEQRLSMLQERTAAYEGDGVGEELDAMDDPEMNPQGEPGYTREMQMNYSRGAPGGAEIARNDMRNRAVDERYFQQGDRTLTNPRTQGFSAAAGPMMDQRRDAELLANARDTYDGQPIPYDDFGTGDMLMRLKKRRPGGLIGGSGPR